MDDDEPRVKLLGEIDVDRAVRVLGVGALLVAVGLWLAGCLEDRTDRPLGSSCSGDTDCGHDLVCSYGRCRAQCSFDRDCPDGTFCVVDEAGGSGVCTLAEEEGCDSDADIGGCEPGSVCVAGECVPVVVPDGDAGADSDVDTDADVDADAAADAAADADADPDVDPDVDPDPDNPCPCDFDGDGDCDMSDFGLLQVEFGTTCPDAGPCPFDLTGDGYVDSSDMAAFEAQRARPECAGP